MDHIITIATKQAPIDTLEPPTMGTLYRWECSCGDSAIGWRADRMTVGLRGAAHVESRLELAVRRLLAASKVVAFEYLTGEDTPEAEEFRNAIAGLAGNWGLLEPGLEGR